MSPEFDHMRYNLIRISICIYNEDKWNKVLEHVEVHYLQLSKERTLRTDALVFLVSETEY